MKRNKLAAGALALALGLGAVAPSFADDAVSTKTEVAATTLFQEKYAEELEKAQKLYEDATAKKARLTKAEADLAKAEERVKAAAKKYADIKLYDDDKVLRSELANARKLLAQLTTVSEGAIEKAETTKTTYKPYPVYELVGNHSVGYTVNVVPNPVKESITVKEPAPFSTFEGAELKDIEAVPASESLKVNPNYDEAYYNEAIAKKWVGDKQLAKNGFGKYLKASDENYGTSKEADAAKEYVGYKPAQASDKRKEEVRVAYERYVNAWTVYQTTIEKRASEKDAAYQELVAAETAYDVAKTEEKNARKAANPAVAKYEAALAKLKAAADAYNVVIVATNNGIEVKGEDDKVVDKKVNYEGLRASIAKANETLRAVEILKSVMPNTSKANMAKLDALVAEQKAAIAKAEAILKAAGQKVALVSTAFASEEATAEEVDALIKELDDNTAAIQDEMKKLDSEVKEEEKPAEKPAEKEEDKKDDDKKEKVVEKVVVKEKAANKKAGSNAKTGIAGVAGVAGVLAAASVAYAASKKNN